MHFLIIGLNFFVKSLYDYENKSPGRNRSHQEDLNNIQDDNDINNYHNIII